MRAVVLAVLAFVLVAGCGDKPAATTDGPKPGDLPALQGYIVDPRIVPLEHVRLTIADANASTETDERGHYAFPTLPSGLPLVVVAELEGFVPSSKSVQLEPAVPFQLNFTMAPVPVAQPYHESFPFDGFYQCAATITLGAGGDRVIDCGLEQNVNGWDFNVGSGLGGIIIEAQWEAGTPLAEFLNLTIETVGLGDQDAVLAQAEGPSVLRAQVSQAQAQKYYAAGGTIRIIASPGTNVEDQETTLGAAGAFQQRFRIVATAFYGGPADPNFSAGA